MAATNVSSKEALVSVAQQLSNDLTTLDGINKNLDSVVTAISDYDGMSLGSAGAKLRNNSNNIETDFKNTIDNISTYANMLVEFDINDYESVIGSDSLQATTKSSGTTITLPSGLGSVHSYMGWQCITSTTSKQYKLRQDAGMNFDSEGYGKIGDRYVVATTTTFGNVGDYIDVKQADGSVIKCIIGDIKSQHDEGCNQWGHNNGQCVVEFVVDKDSWYGKKENPGTSSNHPEWNQNILSITNLGNYWGDNSNVSQPIVSTAVAATTVSSSSSRSYGPSNTSSSYSSTERTYGPSGETTGYSPVHATKVTISSGDPNIDVSKYHNCIENGFEVTVGNTAYELSDKDIELLMAIVSAESDKSYDDALAVITTILNRCEAPNWISSHGKDPVAQATAPNQFVVYQHGSYKAYMNGNAPETVKQAVMDALKGVRNHKYLSFRSNGSVGYSSNMISPTGNRYK